MSYIKKIEIRWSDVDANRHLANAAYITFMSHTRMSFFTENGFGQQQMAEHNIGPVITYERIQYFKEVLPDQPIWVSISLKGLSSDATVFKFVHRFYNREGWIIKTASIFCKLANILALSVGIFSSIPIFWNPVSTNSCNKLNKSIDPLKFRAS